jgi:hypothetical protein
LISWIGWSVGLVRTFFAVCAGFAAIFAADKYPCKEGMNVYLVFSIAALFIILIGAFILRIIKFFYLNIFDRAGGAFLNACVWAVLFVNIIVPSLNSRWMLFNMDNSYVYAAAARTVKSKIHIFKDYIPPFLRCPKKQ